MAELSDNKRIAKNTLLLYVRMLYSLFLSLFTARVILNALGFEDYGLYNVIGSIVSMFVFLRSAMGNSTNRYLAYSIGKGNVEDTQKVFSLSLIIFSALALLIVILCETVGLWFFFEKLNIPEGRFSAALWVYQFSIFTTAVSVICVPYDAIIIGHEKMNVFAVVQILNATLNLGIVYLVAIYPYDKLIFYAFLLMLIQVMNRVIYGVYCGRHFPETKFRFIKDWPLMKEMTSFAGWSLIGNMIWVGYTQGVNLMLNVFFGPVVNAARGIAVHVQGAIKGFVTNFQMAANPQITKSYAAQDYKRLHNLIYFSSKFSFFLLLMLELPIFLEADAILELWLKSVPDHTVSFLRLSLMIMLISALENPIGTANNATGKIKTYQIVVGCFNVFIIILSYLALKIGYPPESVFVVQFAIAFIVQFVKVYLVKNKIGLSMRQYICHLILPLMIATVISVIIPGFIYFTITPGITRMIIIVFVCIFSVIGSAYLFGLNINERKLVQKYIGVFWSKIKGKRLETKE